MKKRLIIVSLYGAAADIRKELKRIADYLEDIKRNEN